MLIIISLAVSGCDPESCLTVRIENATLQSITIYFVSTEYIKKSISNETQTDSLFVEMGLSGIWTDGCVLGNIEFSLEFYDSIYIESREKDILKVYYPNATGKNIYDTENRDVWTKKEQGKRDYEYVFAITEEDISIE